MNIVNDTDLSAVTRQIVKAFRDDRPLPEIGAAAWDWIDALPTKHAPAGVDYWLQQAKRSAYALELDGVQRPRADIWGVLYHLSEARIELKRINRN